MLVFFPIDSMLWQVMSMVCAVCSLLSKEQGVTALGVCVVFDIATSSKVRRRKTQTLLANSKFNSVCYPLLDTLILSLLKVVVSKQENTCVYINHS